MVGARTRAASAAAVMLLAGRAWGQLYTWTGAASNDWFDAANWSPQAVPPIGADVVVPSGLSARVQLAGHPEEIVDLASLNTMYAVDVKRGLRVGGGSMQSPGIDIASPSTAFETTGLLTISGVDGVWRSGTLNGEGEFRNTGTLFVGGGLQRWVYGTTLRNTGTLQLSSVSSRIDLFDAATLINEGALEVYGTEAVNDGPGIGAGGMFVNSGTLRQNLAGEAAVSANIVSTGTISAEGAGRRFRFVGFSQDYRGGHIVLAGGGVVTVIQSTWAGAERPQLGGTVDGTGDLMIGLGRHVVAETMTANLSGASASGLLIDTASTGSVELAADLHNSGKAVWRSGQISGAGSFVNDHTGALTVPLPQSGAALAGRLSNHGSLTLATTLSIGPTAAFVNESDGVLHLLASTGFIGGPPTVIIANRGTILKEGNGSANLSSGTLDNTGTVQVVQGQLSVGFNLVQLQMGELNGGTWISPAGCQLILPSGITKLGPSTTVEASSQSAPWVGNVRENRGRLIVNISGGFGSGFPFKNLGNGWITVKPSALAQFGGGLQNGDATDASALVDMWRAVPPQMEPRIILPAMDNYGRLAPGGIGQIGPFNVAESLTMHAGSSVLVDIGGTATTDFDQFSVGAQAHLAGTVRLSLVNGFVPQLGQEFVWFRAGGGIFDLFDGLAQPAGMPAGLAFELEYGETLVLVRVVQAGPCYANCDGSTAAPVLNVNDFICFQSHFAAGDSYANCDGSTAAPVLNINDFICFQSSFAAGCR